MTCQKNGRPIDSKDKNPRKRKELNKRVGASEDIHTLVENLTQKQVVDINEKITRETF